MRVAQYIGLATGAMLVLQAALAQLPPPGQPVLLVSSHETAAYVDALAGVRVELASAGVSLRVVEPNASGQLSIPRGVAPGTVTVALGTRASDVLRQAGVPAPSLACMVLDAAGRPGVTLVHAPEVRMAWLRNIIPGARTVGALYEKGGSRAEVDLLERAALRAGLKFRSFAVDLSYPMAGQLEQLTDAVDVLLGTYDLRIYSAENAQALLLFSYQNRIPIAGLSDAWASAGALFSLDWDYHDIGHQCGERIVEVLRNPQSASRAADAPRKLAYSLNRRAANYFRISLTPELVRGARRIVE